jgi:hypothetical protein
MKQCKCVKWIWFKVPRCNYILLLEKNKKIIRDVFFKSGM